MGLRDAAAPLGRDVRVGKWGFGSVPPVTLAFLRVAVGGVVMGVALVTTARTE